jgi:hypothetical protein
MKQFYKPIKSTAYPLAYFHKMHINVILTHGPRVAGIFLKILLNYFNFLNNVSLLNLLTELNPS